MKQRTPFKVLFKCFLREYIEHTPMTRPQHALFTQAYLNSGAFLHGVKQKNLQTEQYMKMLIRYFEENYPPVAKVIHAHEQMLREVFDGDYLKMNRWAKPGDRHINYSFEAKVNNGITTVVPVYADSPDKIEVEYRDVNLKSKPKWRAPDGKLVSKSAKHAPASLTPATEQMPELVALVVTPTAPQPEPTELLPASTQVNQEDSGQKSLFQEMFESKEMAWGNPSDEAKLVALRLMANACGIKKQDTKLVTEALPHLSEKDANNMRSYISRMRNRSGVEKGKADLDFRNSPNTPERNTILNLCERLKPLFEKKGYRCPDLLKP